MIVESSRNTAVEEVVMISDFIQLFLADKHMPLFLLISEQPRHELCGNPPHVQEL
jgi:hypothetical protein